MLIYNTMVCPLTPQYPENSVFDKLMLYFPVNY